MRGGEERKVEGVEKDGVDKIKVLRRKVKPEMVRRLERGAVSVERKEYKYG